jgi:RNA polymerase sigma-70 factor (ECF subfamily)
MKIADTSHGLPEFTNPERMKQFVELYSQHYPRLQYYLMALLPISNDAADVMQETSLVLWKKFDSFEIGTNFLAWACKIARLEVLKHYERGGRSTKLFDTRVLEQLAVQVNDSTARPAPPLEILESCLAVLSETDRKLIRRRYEPDTTVNQIAEEIDVTANSLSKMLGRIRRALLTCMERKLSREW